MSGSLVLAPNFPSFFREKTVKQILKCLECGDNVTIIAMPGMGVSSLGMQLSNSPFLKDRKISYFDLNLTSFESQKELTKSLDKKLKLISGSTTIYIDPFERLAGKAGYDFLSHIDGWRRENIDKLSFVFTLENDLVFNKRFDQFEPISRLLLENQIYLPPLNRQESEWFANNVASQYGLKIEKQFDKIFELTGGYMQTIKRVVQAINRGYKLNQLEVDPTIDVHLNYYFVRTLEALEGQKEIIIKLLNNGIKAVDNESLIYLQNMFVLGKDNKFVSPLLEKYIKSVWIKENICELTMKEEKLLNYLSNRKGLLCSKEDIIEAIWGKEKSYEVNNHAFDQLVHRLRKKIEGKENIEIVRGRGIRIIA